jgi:hypothetical protein
MGTSLASETEDLTGLPERMRIRQAKAALSLVFYTRT